MAWFYVQVVGGLQPALPGFGVNLNVVVDVSGFKVHIAADGLVNPFLSARRYFNEGVWAELEARFVHIFYILRNGVDGLNITLICQYFIFDLVPTAQVLSTGEPYCG